MGAPLLIRADASAEIGSGHVMRCLALAQRWQRAGGSAVFASSEVTGPVTQRLATWGFESARLNCVPGTPQDAAATIEAAERSGAEWVVLDGYGFKSEYQERIKRAGFHLLVLDDWGHSDRYAADLVLNPGLAADPGRYRSRERSTKLLLGTRYALIRSEFLAWREWRREIAEVGSRVLVTLGGGFPSDLGKKVLEGLRRADTAEIDVRFVLGPTAQAGWGGCTASLFGVQWLRNVADMSEWMAWADVAVSAAGSTAWELAFMGLRARSPRPGLLSTSVGTRLSRQKELPTPFAA
jgi:UDP-2,4-diacetamido-2,4,6-trideoxy-beta-L-altropyranose hydrolase